MSPPDSPLSGSLEELLEDASDIDMEAREHVERIFEQSVADLKLESEGEDFILIGDNLDFLVKKALSSKFNRNEMIHWFHLIGTLLCVPVCMCVLLLDVYSVCLERNNAADLESSRNLRAMWCSATRCRVSSKHLADDIAMGDMKNWTFLGSLPSEAEISQMREFFSILTGRLLCRRLKWMKEYKMSDAVNREIEHAYSFEMRQKSQEVCVALLTCAVIPSRGVVVPHKPCLCRFRSGCASSMKSPTLLKSSPGCMSSWPA